MEFLARPARSINPHNMGSPPHWAQWFAAHQLLANSRVLGQLPHRHEVPFECVSPSSTVLASFLFRLLESFRRFLWPPVIQKCFCMTPNKKHVGTERVQASNQRTEPKATEWQKHKNTGAAGMGRRSPFLLLATRSRCTCTKRSCLH